MWPNGLHLQLNTCPYPALLRTCVGLRVLVYIGGVAGGGGLRQEALMQWTLSDARHGWQGAHGSGAECTSSAATSLFAGDVRRLLTGDEKVVSRRSHLANETRYADAVARCLPQAGSLPL